MKRTMALGAGWTASAAAAVGLGFLAVSLVDASASPGAHPVAATTTAATSAASTASASVPSGTGGFVTPAGSVFTDCTTGTPVLAAVPVAGWSVDDSTDPGRIEFKSGDQRLEVTVSCLDGGVVSITHDRPSAPATSGRDDSPGRDGGGHGSAD